jgi:hypothetical protein
MDARIEQSNLGKLGAPQELQSHGSRQPPRSNFKSLRTRYRPHRSRILKIGTSSHRTIIYLRLHISSHINMGNEAGPGVGFEFPTFEVKWLKRDLLLFANSIGATYPDELHFLYVSRPRHMICIVITMPIVHVANRRIGTASIFRGLPYLPNHPPIQARGPRCHRLLRA